MDDIERVEVTEIIVPYRDIDMTGRMHNAAYLAHAETALSHFWRYRPPLEDEPHFQPTKIEIRLHEPLHLDDRVKLTVRVDKIGMKSVGFDILIQREGTLAAEVEIVWAATGRNDDEPVTLPETLRDWLYSYLP